MEGKNMRKWEVFGVYEGVYCEGLNLDEKYYKLVIEYTFTLSVKDKG